MSIKQYLINVLIGIDQLKNAILFGDPDETISSRLGKSQRGDYGPKWKIALSPFRVLVDVIFYPIDGKNHCAQSIEDDEGNEDIFFNKR